MVRTPATSWQRGKHRTRMGETENGREVCEHGRERNCTPWQRGNLEKPPGWTGEFALTSYRKSGRQRVSLHGGAHLLLTTLSLQPRLFSVIRAYQQQAGTHRSGPVPQNKLSLLSSCRVKVQDVLRGGSPRRQGQKKVLAQAQLCHTLNPDCQPKLKRESRAGQG